MLDKSSSSSVDAVEVFLQGVLIFPPPECGDMGDSGEARELIDIGENTGGR